MKNQELARCLGVTIALSGLAVACGGGRPSAKPAAAAPGRPTEPRAMHEKIRPHTCSARSKLAELLGRSAPKPAADTDETLESAPPPAAERGERTERVERAGRTRSGANQAYRSVAPATVLIRTAHGVGTGVVIDPAGYVLTNHHVIAEGRKTDFVITANVTFGDMTATGRMTRQEKSYEAVVVKADAIRDMAILKVNDPPPKLASVKLAKSAPQIAERVISLGHAGIGFLWAAKTCSIASVGERQQDAVRLAALDCSNVDPSLDAAERSRLKAKCDESKRQMTEAYASATQGLAVQTDCAITHGDSGGPLVNNAGELVGLNQSISSDLATASFHVHLDEVREFIASHPEEGVPILPDPYCDGGTETSIEDLDGDGVPDTLVTRGSSSPLGAVDRMSLLIDLDQNRAKRAKAASAEEEFDGEIALLTVSGQTYVWYDTDDDGDFDLLLVDKNNDGTPNDAYRLDDKGVPKLVKEALPKHDLSAKYVKDPVRAARLGRIAEAIGGAKYVSAKTRDAAGAATSFPDPILGGGVEGRALDTNDNGRPDVAVTRGPFSRAFLIDADEDSLAALKTGDPVGHLVKAKKVDAEMSVVVQSSGLWAFYDTDNDAKFDLALMTTNGTDPKQLFATQAFRLGAGGEKTPAPEHVGRRVIRPALLPWAPSLPKTLELLNSDLGGDDPLGTFPDPQLGNKPRFTSRESKEFPAGMVLFAETGPWTSMLIDVDRDTKLPKAPKGASGESDEKQADYQALLKDKKFDFEVAFVHQSAAEGPGSDWIFYDTDNDGELDLVLHAAKGGEDTTHAWRVTKKGKEKKLEPDPGAGPGRAFRHSVFKNKAVAAKWKSVAAKLFRSATVED